MLLQNRQGKTRLSKWYVPYDDTEKQAIQVQEGSVRPFDYPERAVILQGITYPDLALGIT